MSNLLDLVVDSVRSIRWFFGIKTINTPDTPPPPTPSGETNPTSNHGKKVGLIAFDNAMSLIDMRINNSNRLMVAVIIVLAICFLSLYFNYIQFTSTSFNDYSQKVKELNDQRYEIFNDRLMIFEKLLTPTPTPSVPSVQN